MENLCDFALPGPGVCICVADDAALYKIFCVIECFVVVVVAVVWAGRKEFMQIDGHCLFGWNN